MYNCVNMAHSVFRNALLGDINLKTKRIISKEDEPFLNLTVGGWVWSRNLQNIAATVLLSKP